MHEIGHCLGLAHPHDDGNDSVQITTGSFDTHNGWSDVPFTAMSYNDMNDASDRTPNPRLECGYGFMKSWGVFDIVALQIAYGRPSVESPSAGDTVYRLPSSNGTAAEYLDPGSWSVVWDAGGQDTITAEGHMQEVEIDLSCLRDVYVGRSGSNAFSGDKGKPHCKLVVGFGVELQHAVGGSGDDRIVGSRGDNNLTGGPGDDTICSRGGNDVVEGGPGVFWLDGVSPLPWIPQLCFTTLACPVFADLLPNPTLSVLPPPTHTNPTRSHGHGTLTQP